MKKVIFILFLVLLNACQTTSNVNKVSSNSKTTKNFLNANNDCKAITLQDVKNLDVNDTDMKNPSGLFSFNSEYAIYVKTKNCSKWRIIPETSTNNFWDPEKDIMAKFQIAVKDVATIEQSIRDKFNLGKRDKLLMEKAQEWSKALDKYCESSIIGCNAPDVDCMTILGKTYCIWGSGQITSN